MQGKEENGGQSRKNNGGVGRLLHQKCEHPNLKFLVAPLAVTDIFFFMENRGQHSSSCSWQHRCSCHTRAPHKQLTNGVSLSEQLSFKLGFERVHWVGQSNNKREIVPTSRTSGRENMIDEERPHPPHTGIGPLKWSEPWLWGMSPSAAIAQERHRRKLTYQWRGVRRDSISEV